MSLNQSLDQNLLITQVPDRVGTAELISLTRAGPNCWGPVTAFTLPPVRPEEHWTSPFQLKITDIVFHFIIDFFINFILPTVFRILSINASNIRMKTLDIYLL